MPPQVSFTTYTISDAISQSQGENRIRIDAGGALTACAYDIHEYTTPSADEIYTF